MIFDFLFNYFLFYKHCNYYYFKNLQTTNKYYIKIKWQKGSEKCHANHVDVIKEDMEEDVIDHVINQR